MAKSPVVKITWLGDAASATKSAQDVGNASAKAEVKVEGFGKTFLKAGLAFEAGRMALQLFAQTSKAALSAVTDYNLKTEQSEQIILGVTKSQQALTDVKAIARKEEAAGRATYQNSIAALAQLIPLSQRYGGSLEQLVQTQQILAAADPAQGLEGAAVALREALSGDFTSLIRRFEIPRTAIQKLKDEGVPNLEIVRRALADLGYDQNFLAIANQNGAKQVEIFKGKITELGAEVEKPILDLLINGITKLNEVLHAGGDSPSFISLLVQDIQAITTGHFLDQWAVTIGQVLFLLADAGNKITEKLTFGKLTLFSPEDMQNFRTNIIAAQNQITTDIQQHVTKPLADGLSGAAPGSPIAPTKLEGYGRDIIQSFLNGLTSAQVGDFEGFAKQFEDLFKGADDKVDTGRFSQATGVLAQALTDIKDTGQLTAKTFYDLAAIFGDNALNVATLTVRYGEQIAAQDRATVATNALVESQQRQQQVLNDNIVRLRDYEGAVVSATETAKTHAEASAAAAEAASDRLQDANDAAAASARENAAAIDVIQEATVNHAAAYAAQEAAAQAELTAIQERRKEEAQKLYDTIVDGERRASDAAQNRVNALSAKAHKEDLGLLRQIQAARDAGDPREAARLTSELANQKKRRQGAEELAAAEAAVAKDDFDAADKAANKAVERKDAEIAKEEEAAKAKLAAIQEAAKSQATADAAAIKGAQDAAKADADRYAAQQRGIQAEIDRIQDAAKEQAKSDAAAITAAQTRYNQQKEFNDKIAIQLGGINHWEELRAGNAKDSATAAKDFYDWISKIYGIYAANPPGSPGGPPLPSTPGATGGGTDERSGARQASGAPSAAEVATANRQAGINNWLSYYGPYNIGPAMSRDYSPPGFHAEDRASGTYWVRDGYTADPSGTVALPANQSTSRGGRGGSASLRAAGTGSGSGFGLDAPVLGSFNGPALPPGAQGSQTIHLHINAPNLTDAGNPAQQRALAAQAGEALRAWDGIRRGGSAANG